MVISFFNANEEKVYICTEQEKTRVVSINDANLMDYVPNDDILYVQNAHYITKNQFGDWVNGEMALEDDNFFQKQKSSNRFTGFLDNSKFTKQNFEDSKMSEKRWIHPTNNGAVIIEDIRTKKYPDGIKMMGKYDCVDLDDIGGKEAFDDSPQFRFLINKNKIEVVDHAWVKENAHKKSKKISPSEAALNKILVPADIKAEAAAEAGGIQYASNSSIEVIVD